VSEIRQAQNGGERNGIGDIVAELAERSMTLACAESLTGGALCSAFVDVPGVSAVLRGSITAYAVDIKASILGVDRHVLQTKGPVEERVAVEMARGVCDLLAADVALATTGVAGPGPADGHPAGTVWIACAGKLGEQARLHRFFGGRADVRSQTVDAAVNLLIELLGQTPR
jgi:competence/damage-inducible protein CinA C-terminal domain